MGLKNFKNNDNSNDDDEYKALMCSFLGCKNRWSVKIDAPMCSFHQWGAPKEKKQSMWYDKEKYE